MTSSDGLTEADITINGVPLTFAQSMTLRVAISSFAMTMKEPDALGADEHGRIMAASYLRHCRDMERIIVRNQP